MNDQWTPHGFEVCVKKTFVDISYVGHSTEVERRQAQSCPEHVFKDDHFDDDHTFSQVVVEDRETVITVAFECSQDDELDMDMRRDSEEANHRCLRLRPVPKKSLWACSMSHDSVDLDAILDRYECAEPFSSEPSRTRILESKGTFDCDRDNSITAGLDAKELDMPVSSVSHAMNIALAINASDVGMMLQRFGEHFPAKGSEAETWIQQPPSDMWSFERGQLIIAQLGESTKPDEAKYYTALLTFQHTLMECGKDIVSDLHMQCEILSSMPFEDAAVSGNSRHGKRRGRRSSATRMRCHLFLDPIMLDSGFDLVKKIIGRSGCNTFGIFQDTNTKVRVRGKGSGHRENNGREAPVPLMVALSADHENDEDFRSAYVRTRELLEGVCERFKQYRLRNRRTVPTAKLFWFGDLSESAKEALSDYLDESQRVDFEWQ